MIIYFIIRVSSLQYRCTPVCCKSVNVKFSILVFNRKSTETVSKLFFKSHNSDTESEQNSKHFSLWQSSTLQNWRINGKNMPLLSQLYKYWYQSYIKSQKNIYILKDYKKSIYIPLSPPKGFLSFLKIKYLSLLFFPESKTTIDIFANFIVTETANICIIFQDIALIWGGCLYDNFRHRSLVYRCGLL